MSWFLLAVASALIFGMAGFLIKVVQHKGGSPSHMLLGLYLTGGLLTSVGAAVEGVWSLSPGLILAGLAVGAGSILGNLHYLRALKYGPASLTSPLVNLNIALVVIMAILFYGEALSAAEAAGVVLLTVAVLLLPVDPQESRSITSRRWYVLTGLSLLFFALRNGGLKVTWEAGLASGAVLAYGYLLGLAGVTAAMVVAKQRRRPPVGSPKVGLRYGLLAGFASFGGMRLYALALETGPASIVSPLFATNSLVVALLSMVLLRERISPLQTAALTGLMAGLVLLRMG